MPQFTSQLLSETDARPAVFWFEDTEFKCFTEQLSQEKKLMALMLKVSRSPKDLFSHLRRIFFCYQNRLHEPLYAALLDWLIVLNGKGSAMSLRLLQGCRTRLEPAEYLIFKHALGDPLVLPGNRFSLFTKGLIGVSRLVEIAQANDQHVDFMQLAQDYIEFSQLDEAMAVLETGLEVEPERTDLQVALLELYQATANLQRFKRRFQSLTAAGIAVAEGWYQFNTRLAGENHG